MHLLPGRRSQQSGCPRLSLAVPTSPACARPTHPPRLIPRCGNRTLKQVVTPAPGPAPRAALETSATPVTKPRHPPRPHVERSEPGPASLSSALGHPLPAALHTPPEASKTPFSLLGTSFLLLRGTSQQATEGPVGMTRGNEASRLGTGLPRTHKASREAENPSRHTSALAPFRAKVTGWTLGHQSRLRAAFSPRASPDALGCRFH